MRHIDGDSGVEIIIIIIWQDMLILLCENDPGTYVIHEAHIFNYAARGNHLRGLALLAR